MTHHIGRAGVAPSRGDDDTWPLGGYEPGWDYEIAEIRFEKPADALTPPEDREDHQGPESGAEHPLAPWYREVRRIALSQ